MYDVMTTAVSSASVFNNSENQKNLGSLDVNREKKNHIYILGIPSKEISSTLRYKYQVPDT